MARSFNVTGPCDPQLHYMVDITGRLEKIKELVDAGKYFTINRARQYGKTTTIHALTEYLKNDYVVVSLDFQEIGEEEFENARIFSAAFSEYFLDTIESEEVSLSFLDENVLKELRAASENPQDFTLRKLFVILSKLCKTAGKRLILIIDEVDSAANNQVFLDFLAQLRSYYLKRRKRATFQSVILAGVYDVKNIKMKIRPEPEHKVNSPWNIAADFPVDMSFRTDDIRGMLEQYETEHHTGMDTGQMAGLMYDATSGYPFLVSRLCQLIDERLAGTEQFPDGKAAWTKEGYREAEKMLSHERNTLFDSLTGKLADDPELKTMLKAVLFTGLTVSYATGNQAIEMAAMYGFVRDINNTVAIANRIFETVLYNLFLSEEEVNSAVYASAATDKYQFIKGGRLDMPLILERFVQTFTDLYRDEDDRFKEETGRKYFMLFLRPIINGTGHCYVEARTRNMRRTDLVVNYHDEEYVIELKIWRGPKYHEDGERQIAEYLDYYGLKTGYMLTFSFVRDKEIGVKEIRYGDRTLIEATV